jgi:hypothetical protein
MPSLLVAAALIPSAIHAQTPHRVTRTPAELVAAFEGDFQAGTPSAARGDVAHVLAHPDDYAPADLDRFLQGLEQLAMTGSSSRLRASAAISLSLPGSRRQPHPVRVTFARLKRIYLDLGDPLVRAVAVGAMADVVERQEALVFLEQLATKGPGDPDFPHSVRWALRTLPAMNAEGRVVLKRLHESHAVRDQEARHGLSVLAGRGYQSN